MRSKGLFIDENIEPLPEMLSPSNFLWLLGVVIFLSLLLFSLPKKESFSKREPFSKRKPFHVDFLSRETLGGKPRTLCFLAGTHGNEPAGTVALLRLIERFRKNGFPFQGRVRIIPAVNPWGLGKGVRGSNWWGRDLNRIYTPPFSQEALSLLSLCEEADLVVDFHEGWGFHHCQPESLGSTLSPSRDVPPGVAEGIVGKLNQLSRERCGTWSVLRNTSCEIPSSLGCCLEKKAIPYLLVETTGQGNIQPLELRVQQVELVLRELLARYLG